MDAQLGVGVAKAAWLPFEIVLACRQQGPVEEFWAAFGEARPDAAALDAAVAVAESKLPAVAAPSSVKLYRLSDEGVGRGEVAVEEVLHRLVNARVKSPKWGRTV